MGFQALLIREDYYSILRKTIHQYYSDRYGRDVYVGYDYREGSREFIMNPKLGMIYVVHPNKKIRDYIYKSYNIRNNIFKNIAAKIFVFISTHTNGMFTLPRKLYVSPGDIVDENIVFSYLNRSIRIFNFKNDTTVSIQKNSFTLKYFDNQLAFRLKYRYDFIPSILDSGERWFEECILDGRSLARETNLFFYEQGLNKALMQMRKIQEATLQTVDGHRYVVTLISSIQELLNQAHIKKEILTYDASNQYLETLNSLLKLEGKDIPVAESHGDLQAGNIWLDRDTTWIIDWETHAIRSVWFDAATIYFGTRYYGGIKKMVENHQTFESRTLLLGDFKCELSMKAMTIIFLLEDLLFNLEDMMELPSVGGKESFDGYMNDIMTVDFKKKLAE